METLPEAEKMVTQVYKDYIECIDPTMEREAMGKVRNAVEWEGDGSYMIDVAGNRFLDSACGGGVFGLGYRHPKVIEAVTRQLQRMPMPSRGALNPLQAQLARRLQQVTPGALQFSHIAASGTEAIEVALKVARLHTGRHGVVATQGTFHGMSLAATCIGGIPYLHQGVLPMIDGISHVPYGDIDAMRKAVSARTSAVILEPIQTATGVVVPPEGYLQQVRALCNEHGALLVMDEIQTAIRTGTFLGCTHDGVLPDIACLGKVLGGGVMPIGVAIWIPEVQESVSKKPFFNSTTFGGNQLSCAAAMAVLDVVEEENLLTRVVEVGGRLRVELERLIKAYPRAYCAVHGRGLMLSLELTDPKSIAAVIPRLLRRYRLMLLHSLYGLHKLRINPPLNIQEPELRRIVEVLEDLGKELDAMTPEKIQAIYDGWCQGQIEENI